MAMDTRAISLVVRERAICWNSPFLAKRSWLSEQYLYSVQYIHLKVGLEVGSYKLEPRNYYGRKISETSSEAIMN